MARSGRNLTVLYPPFPDMLSWVQNDRFGPIPDISSRLRSAASSA